MSPELCGVSMSWLLHSLHFWKLVLLGIHGLLCCLFLCWLSAFSFLEIDVLFLPGFECFLDLVLTIVKLNLNCLTVFTSSIPFLFVLAWIYLPIAITVHWLSFIHSCVEGDHHTGLHTYIFSTCIKSPIYLSKNITHYWHKKWRIQDLCFSQLLNPCTKGFKTSSTSVRSTITSRENTVMHL